MTPAEYLAKFGVWVGVDPVAAIQYELVGALMEQRGDLGIVVTVLREDGSPSVGDPFVINQFPDGHGDDPRNPDGSGVVSFSGASTSSAYTPPARGPFSISLVAGNVYKDPDTKMLRYDTLLSPVVQGLGDYLAQHTRWYLQFRKAGAAPPPPIVPTIRSADELRNLAYGAIYPQGISFLASAALVVAARSHGLGAPVTNEGTFIDPVGRLNRWQGFSGGIVACLDGHYLPADFIVTPW